MFILLVFKRDKSIKIKVLHYSLSLLTDFKRQSIKLVLAEVLRELRHNAATTKLHFATQFLFFFFFFFFSGREKKTILVQIFLGSLQHLEENNFSLTWITHCPLLNLPARRIRSLKKIFKAVFVVNKVVSFSILKNWYLHYHFGKFPRCNCTWPILKFLLKVLQKNEIPLEQQTFTSMKYHYDYDKINLSYCQIPRPNTSKKYILWPNVLIPFSSSLSFSFLKKAP